MSGPIRKVWGPGERGQPRLPERGGAMLPRAFGALLCQPRPFPTLLWKDGRRRRLRASLSLSPGRETSARPRGIPPFLERAAASLPGLSRSEILFRTHDSPCSAERPTRGRPHPALTNSVPSRQGDGHQSCPGHPGSGGVFDARAPRRSGLRWRKALLSWPGSDVHRHRLAPGQNLRDLLLRPGVRTDRRLLPRLRPGVPR